MGCKGTSTVVYTETVVLFISSNKFVQSRRAPAAAVPYAIYAMAHSNLALLFFQETGKINLLFFSLIYSFVYILSSSETERQAKRQTQTFRQSHTDRQTDTSSCSTRTIRVLRTTDGRGQPGLAKLILAGKIPNKAKVKAELIDRRKTSLVYVCGGGRDICDSKGDVWRGKCRRSLWSGLKL